MNADGSAQMRLTANASFDGSVAWSPDGSKLAFSSFRDGNYEIYSMSADGSAQTRLTSTASSDQAPDWQRIDRATMRRPLPAADTTAPSLGHFRVSRSRFRVGRSPTALAAARPRTGAGTRFLYALSEPATVAIAIDG